MKIAQLFRIDCVFRSDIRQEGSEVTAECGLVRTIAGKTGLYESLLSLGQQAVKACGPYADNTSAVAIRLHNGKAAS